MIDVTRRSGSRDPGGGDPDRSATAPDRHPDTDQRRLVRGRLAQPRHSLARDTANPFSRAIRDGSQQAREREAPRTSPIWISWRRLGDRAAGLSPGASAALPFMRLPRCRNLRAMRRGCGLWILVLALAAFLLGTAFGTARAVVRLPNGFSDELVTGGLEYPVGMAFLPDGRLLVVEQTTARVRLIAPTPVSRRGDRDHPEREPLRTRARAARDRGRSGLAGQALRLRALHLGQSGPRCASRATPLTGDLDAPATGSLTLDPASRTTSSPTSRTRCRATTAARCASGPTACST